VLKSIRHKTGVIGFTLATFFAICKYKFLQTRVGRTWKLFEDIAIMAGGMATGIFLMDRLDDPWDYILYPNVVDAYGAIHGGLIMTLLSFFLDLFYIRLYDRMKTDIFQFEKLKVKKERIRQLWGKKGIWAVNISMFIFLTFKANPAVVVVCFREGAYRFGGMTRRDWGMFLLAMLAAHVFWTSMIYWVIQSIEWLGTYLPFVVDVLEWIRGIRSALADWVMSLI
jgi:hypothetical protein